MQVTAADVARIPAENVRVRRADFAALWVAAERFHDDRVARRVPDWYGAGVVVTCRWLARATVRPDIGPGYPADSPVTERAARALPELIEAEYLAAVKLAATRPRWLLDRPGWIEAIEATLSWAWHGEGRPPLDLAASGTG